MYSSIWVISYRPYDMTDLRDIKNHVLPLLNLLSGSNRKRLGYAGIAATADIKIENNIDANFIFLLK